MRLVLQIRQTQIPAVGHRMIREEIGAGNVAIVAVQHDPLRPLTQQQQVDDVSSSRREQHSGFRVAAHQSQAATIRVGHDLLLRH